MDTTIYSEGRFITPQMVNQSPTKIGVVLSEAKPEVNSYGNEQLVCEVQIDSKIKLWSLNKDSVKNMQQLSVDSKLWISRKVRFMTVTVKGKESVIGNPILE